MIFKEDWEQCQLRFDAFWEGEIIDRCLISVISPRKIPIETNLKRMKFDSLEDQWMNVEKLHHNFLCGCHHAFFGGEAFPNFFPNLGPGVIAAYLGSSYVLAKDTVWFDRDPLIKDITIPVELHLNQDTLMWQVTKKMTEHLSRYSLGDYQVALTDIGGSLDIPAALRSTELLLTDLYDNPEEIKRLTAMTDSVWFDIYQTLYSMINQHMEGISTWLPLWCRKRYYTLQCDFSAMISPSHFNEFVLPTIMKQVDYLDYSIYHLDGPGQLVHLDTLLDIKGLTGIQWVPGSGIPNEMDEKWYPIYRKIQLAGKNLVISCQDPNDIEKLLCHISPEGLFIYTRCASEEESRNLLKKVERLSTKKK